jgi:hypothetical protein
MKKHEHAIRNMNDILELQAIENSLSIHSRIVEKPITEHPDFNKPQYDWGVRPAYTIYGYFDEEANDYVEDEEVPEDRTGWRQEWEGYSLADFWDASNGRFIKDSPKEYRGLTHFLTPEMTATVEQ